MVQKVSGVALCWLQTSHGVLAKSSSEREEESVCVRPEIEREALYIYKAM